MIVLLVFAAALVIEIPLSGRLTGCEALMALYFFASPLLPRELRPPLPPRSHGVRLFYILIGAWFAGAVLTDLYRDTAFADLSRGWSKIAFLCINLAVIRMLVGRDVGRLLVFIVALFVFDAVRLALGLKGEDLLDDGIGDGWRYGYGALATVAVLLLSERLARYPEAGWLGKMLPFASAGLNLAMNARNLFGISALAALANLVTAGRRRPMARSSLALLLVAGVVSGYAIVAIYSYAAANGLLGLDAQMKYEMQYSGDLGIILGGRRESLGSIQAIIDSPLLGHGSWARDYDYVVLMYSRLEEAGTHVNWNAEHNDLIPTHSMLLGSWVEAGVLGAVFWFWALSVTLRALLSAIEHPLPHTGLIAFVGLTLVWDIFFSPLGSERRVIVAAWIYLMILVAERPAEVRLGGGR